MSLWHCYANGSFGRFGDYVLAKTRNEAMCKFRLIHKVWPTDVRVERKAK